MSLFVLPSLRLKILGLGSALFFLTSLACANEVLDWDESHQIQNACIKDSPALARFNDKLYLAHQGESDQLWYTATMNGNEWDPDKQIENASISCSPALAVFNDKLYVAHQGSRNSGQLWYAATTDGKEWEHDKQIEKVSISGSPALAVFDDKLYIVYKCKDSCKLSYTITEDGEEWAEQKQIPDIKISGSPALAVFNDKLYAVYQSNNESWYTTTTSGEVWTEPKQIPNIKMAYSPALAVFDDKLYLAYQGKSGCGQLWYAVTSDGEVWASDNQTKERGIFKMSFYPALAGFGDKLYLAYQGPVESGNLWYTKAAIKGYLRVSLKDFVFDSPLSDLDKYLAENNKKLLEMASTQRLNIADNDLGVTVSNIYERSIQETFSWGLNQKFNTQVSTKFKCGLDCIAAASQSIDVSASFEFGAHEDWSTSRTKKFTVTAGMAPKEKGLYELGLKVYCVDNLELPFTATAKLTATTGIYGGKDAVHQTGRKLNAAIAAALFEKSGGKMEAPIRTDEEKRCIRGKIKGTMKATYGVLQEVIARKIEPIEKPVEVTGETRNEVKNMGANKRVNKVNAERGNRGRKRGN